MGDNIDEITERFERYCDGNITPEIHNELQSMLRLYSISAEELDFKWQAYAMKMGAEDTKLSLNTSRQFKANIQDTLERESKGKAAQGRDGRRTAPTPRSGAKGADDVFGFLDGLVPNTPQTGTVKRKSNFQTPGTSKANKTFGMSSPAGGLTPGDTNGGASFDFSAREHIGDITEQLNGQIPLSDPPEEPPAESRIKLKANTDMSKFTYKTMAMKLSEASEVLDDRIDEFRQLIQESLELDDSAFGNPSHQSPSEIIAIGRIASDSSEGKLNGASILLEGSRRWGSGRRVPLKLDNLTSYNFFPGQIVALRGINASGDFFTVNEILALPLLNQPASKPDELDVFNSRFLDTPESDPDNLRPLTILVASGPYTTDQNLDYAPLHTLLDNAATSLADAVILSGPFLDAEHPLIRSGDFDIPPHVTNPDQATMTDLFRHHISSAVQAFTQRVPTCNVIIVPNLRDAHHKHAAWPQDKFFKKELGLGKQVQCVTNPMTLSMNEMTIGMSSIDILDMLRREELVGGKARTINLYERGARNVIEQRSFLPVFPPTGQAKLAPLANIQEKLFKNGSGDVEMKDAEAQEEEEGPSPFLPLGTMLDTSYLKLGEMLNVRPDILITPSVLQGCVKVVESVLVINPGTLSKRRAAGTYARIVVQPASISDDERERGLAIAHKLWERARVDIVKI
ncbi:DNA polymeras-like protein alpha/primase associated subunit [Aaosphaeria arxii CBS 175.79]|uniref:DNA polymerase alpha subunit B n=1 Tax=Aaosphaeria arxii CBS 175.79 TaxID=1450172 RepID=A0A6A5XG70_9PLEO|nr:DNA polymeras-like protein alpha/primase associated subunit [Aaosphaeria arxii CBS 175.79]KAF2011364.1 DNA polymeras-like protein alpha/primase associated subunit [Aaosphaeria arxii CBS 175.79]